MFIRKVYLNQNILFLNTQIILINIYHEEDVCLLAVFISITYTVTKFSRIHFMMFAWTSCFNYY